MPESGKDCVLQEKGIGVIWAVKRAKVNMGGIGYGGAHVKPKAGRESAIGDLPRTLMRRKVGALASRRGEAGTHWRLPRASVAIGAGGNC